MSDWKKKQKGYEIKSRRYFDNAFREYKKGNFFRAIRDGVHSFYYDLAYYNQNWGKWRTQAIDLYTKESRKAYDGYIRARKRGDTFEATAQQVKSFLWDCAWAAAKANSKTNVGAAWDLYSTVLLGKHATHILKPILDKITKADRILRFFPQLRNESLRSKIVEKIAENVAEVSSNLWTTETFRERAAKNTPLPSRKSVFPTNAKTIQSSRFVYPPFVVEAKLPDKTQKRTRKLKGIYPPFVVEAKLPDKTRKKTGNSQNRTHSRPQLIKTRAPVPARSPSLFTTLGEALEATPHKSQKPDRRAKIWTPHKRSPKIQKGIFKPPSLFTTLGKALEATPHKSQKPDRRVKIWTPQKRSPMTQNLLYSLGKRLESTSRNRTRPVQTGARFGSTAQPLRKTPANPANTLKNLWDRGNNFSQQQRAQQQRQKQQKALQQRIQQQRAVQARMTQSQNIQQRQRTRNPNSVWNIISRPLQQSGTQLNAQQRMRKTAPIVPKTSRPVQKNLLIQLGSALIRAQPSIKLRTKVRPRTSVKPRIAPKTRPGLRR